SDDVTFGNVISGSGSLTQAGTGNLILIGTNTYTGGTTISAGTLQLGNGGNTGSIVGNVTDNGALVSDRSDDTTFNGVVSGTGTLSQIGGGVLLLNGINTYRGGTTVADGTLRVGDGAHGSASIAGDVSVDSGATLGGHGTIGGNVDVASGAHLAPGAGDIGTLTVNGNLGIAQGGIVDEEFGAPGASFGSFGAGDSVKVGGNLTLNGATLNVNADPDFGAGLYNVFSYGGTLTETNGGIMLGTMPAGDMLRIQTLTGAKQINLLNTTGMTLNIWNGNGLASPTQMGGGSGIWSATAPNWTDVDGDVTSSMQPQPGFAIFGGAAGTVTVDNSAGAVAAMGMQFATNGYVLAGDTLTLVADANGNAPTIRVGDGSTSGASDVATIENVLAGTHGLNKSDYGTLVLTGANTYTGDTTISAGTLQLGNGGSTGSVTGNVTDNGALAFDRSDAVSFGGVISGSGSLTQLGSGTLSLTGVNSYTGLTTISAGTLALSGNGSIADSSGVLDNGTFDIGNTTSGASIVSLSGSGAVTLGAQSLSLSNAADTFSGVIAGSGGLTLGGGTETLTGSNSYTGGTTIAAGTLQLGNGGTSGSITGNVADNGALVFDRSDDVAFAGTISGTGSLTKQGAASLTLSGASSYTGGTDASAGTLDVEGSLASSVSVDSGATLTGTGSMGGMAIASGATVSPGGNGVGTLTVNGNLSIASGASYQVDALDSGSSDLIKASGAATLNGGSVVSMEAGSNWNASTKYTILSADSGVTGTFGSASSNFAFLTPTLSYDANDAYLTLARNATTFPSVGVTFNERHTGAAIEALGSASPIYNAVLPLTEAQAQAAFNNLAGDSLASTRTAMIDDSHYVRDAINNHLQGVQGAGGIARQDDAQGSVWASAWGHGGNHDSDGNAARLSSNGSGLLVGADRDLGTWRLGAVAGASQLSDSTSGAADAHSTATVLGLYTGLDLGAWQLQGGAAHSWYETRSHRTIDVPGLAGLATASYHTGVTQAYVDGGYRFQLARGSLTPYVDLARVWLHQNAINEGGDVAALDVQANGSAVNYGTVGLRGVYAPSAGLQLHASVGYQHAWGDLASLDQQHFANGGSDSFSVAGLPVAMNAGIVDLGMRFALGKNVTLDASYHGQFASQAKDQGARMTLDVSF
ncbi:MAG TPA: autotransporter domain-containing protein, partial [Rhodanobacter sp.]